MRTAANLTALISLALLCPRGFAAEASGPAPAATQVYKNPGDRELKITLTFPKDWHATDHRPALIFFYNGGWKPTAADNRQFIEQTDYFARRGMVCARADYREKAKAGPTSPKCIEDVFSAIRWLRKNADRLGIDPERVAAGGGSGSIHLAASILYQKEIHAADDDLSISAAPGALFLFDCDLDVLDSAMMQRLRGSGGEAKSLVEFPPTLIFYGSRDSLAPYMAEFIAQAKKAGLPIEPFVENDGIHGSFKFSPWLEKTTARIDETLQKIGYLKEQPKAQLPTKPRPADLDQRILESQKRWLEKHKANE